MESLYAHKLNNFIGDDFAHLLRDYEDQDFDALVATANFKPSPAVQQDKLVRRQKSPQKDGPGEATKSRISQNGKPIKIVGSSQMVVIPSSGNNRTPKFKLRPTNPQPQTNMMEESLQSIKSEFSFA